MRLDIGCGRNKHEGFIGVDKEPLPGVDVVHDLNELPWPFPDNSVEEIIAFNVLEHLECPFRAVLEMIRISRPGAVWHIRFPYWEHENAWKDPDHKYALTPEFFKRFLDIEVVSAELHFPHVAPRLNALALKCRFGFLRKYLPDEWRLKVVVRK